MLFQAILNASIMERSTVRSKVVGLVAAAALLASIGTASAKDPVKLTDGQLDKVTAGGYYNAGIPLNAAIFANANGNVGIGGVNPSASLSTNPMAQVSIPTTLSAMVH